jgi:dihydroxyacetone kinase
MNRGLLDSVESVSDQAQQTDHHLGREIELTRRNADFNGPVYIDGEQDRGVGIHGDPGVLRLIVDQAVQGATS